MGVKRKQHGAKFEAQVAMAALARDKTLAELSSGYGVHVTMISTWKQEFRPNCASAVPHGQTVDD